MSQDFHGDKFKWFVGIVKSIDDPKASNRVKVFIPGIHPPIDNTTAVDQPTGNLTTPGTPQSPPGTTPAPYKGNAGNPATPKTPSSVDVNSLPTASNLNAQISTHYKLRDLVLAGGSAGANMRAVQAGKLTQHIIQNLTLTAVNILEPLWSAGYHPTITSGWRAAGFSQTHTANHATGNAVDVVLGSQAGMKGLVYPLARLLYGKFSFIYYEVTHIHLQHNSTGEGSAVGTDSNPYVMFLGSHATPYTGQ